MSNITLVGTAPVRVAPGKDYPLEVYNNGTGSGGTVYVSRNPGVSPTQFDYAIGPRGKATVVPGVELYICTDTGATASAFYHSDGTAVDLGSVSITSDAEVLYQNLAYINVNDGVTHLLLDSSNLSAWQTLAISYNNADGGGSAAGVDVTRILVEWLTLTGIPIITQGPYFSTNGFGNYQIPVQGPRVKISINNASAFAPAVPITILGIASLLPRAYYNEPGATGRANGVTVTQSQTEIFSRNIGYQVTVNANGAILYIPSFGGEFYSLTRMGTALAASAMLSTLPQVGISGAQVTIDVFGAAAAVNHQSGVVAPERPLALSFQGLTSQFIINYTWKAPGT